MKLFFPGMFFSGMIILAAESTSLSTAQANPISPAVQYIASINASSQIFQIRSDIGLKKSQTSHPTIPHPILHALANLLGINHAQNSSSKPTTNSHTAYSNFNSSASTSSSSTHSSLIGGFFHGIASAIGNTIHAIASPILNTISTITRPITNAIHATVTLVGEFSYLTKVTLQRAVRDIINRQNFAPAPLLPSAEVLDAAAGKIPVILVPGGYSNSDTVLPYYNSFEKAGIPTYAPTLGNGPSSLAAFLDPSLGGTDYINHSSLELANFIDKVQKTTNSPKVDLVAISQGGLIARDYLVHDQKDNIESVVNMGGAEHGSTINGLEDALHSIPQPLANIYRKVMGAVNGPANIDLLSDSPLVQELDKYPDTKPGINYLNVSSNTDTFVSPGEKAGFLTAGPGAKVTNVEVHTIPGVTSSFNHLQFATLQPVIDRAVQYIQENGQTGPGILGVTRTSDTSSSSSASTTPAQQQTNVTPPTSVSILGG